jgi:hypothetical protein
MYSCSETTTGALGDAGDLFQILPVLSNPILIHSIRLGQFTLEADTNAAMTKVGLYSATTAGLGGTNPAASNPKPLLPGTEAADAAVLWNNTTDGAGTEVVYLEDSWNVQAGWLWLPTPEERIWVSNNAAFIISNQDTVATCDITLTVVFEEFKMV